MARGCCIASLSPSRHSSIIIESSGVELQKLQLALQKAHQQNWHLAQANSHMLALKALRHELGCAAAAAHRAKKFQLEEAKRLHKQPENKISIEVEERISKPIHLVPDESHPDNHKKYHNLCVKRMLRSQPRKSKEKEKDARRRRSVTRRSGNVNVEQSDPTEDLFEIADL